MHQTPGQQQIQQQQQDQQVTLRWQMLIMQDSQLRLL
jgi:hypothetical protein